MHDPLTGLANRRLFDERFAEALSYRGSRHRTAAMMIDIDHFKLYNDHYGHQAGDVCLVTLAQCMEGCLKSHGVLVARTGGEEFSVLLPNTSLDTALAHAQDLLQAINKLKLPHEVSPTGTSVTVSIGVAAQQPNLTSPADIMRAADQAMYQAKANGRNRVEAYHPYAQPSPVDR
jgi:diguanylate cyclase (GGDEF)-like protein